MSDIFISYAREDRDQAERLAHVFAQSWRLPTTSGRCKAYSTTDPCVINRAQSYLEIIVRITISGVTRNRTGRMLVPMPVVTNR